MLVQCGPSVLCSRDALRTRLRLRPPYLCVMSLRLRKKPPAPSLQRRHQLEISVLARNQALHYLANHPLTEVVVFSTCRAVTL